MGTTTNAQFLASKQISDINLLEQNLFETIFFLRQNFFGPEIFLTEIFFYQNILLTQKIILPKNFFT